MVWNPKPSPELYLTVKINNALSWAEIDAHFLTLWLMDVSTAQKFIIW